LLNKNYMAKNLENGGILGKKITRRAKTLRVTFILYQRSIKQITIGRSPLLFPLSFVLQLLSYSMRY
jgi:hypothetical protein